MKRLLIAAVLAAGPAMADLVAKSGDDTLRLTEEACPVTMAKHLPADIIGRFMAAVALVDGQTYLGCWTLRPDGQVFLRYEDGDAGLVPLTLFKHDPGI